MFEKSVEELTELGAQITTAEIAKEKQPMTTTRFDFSG